jgi:hypothetical protein
VLYHIVCVSESQWLRTRMVSTCRLIERQRKINSIKKYVRVKDICPAGDPVNHTSWSETDTAASAVEGGHPPSPMSCPTSLQQLAMTLLRTAASAQQHNLMQKPKKTDSPASRWCIYPTETPCNPIVRFFISSYVLCHSATLSS